MLEVEPTRSAWSYDRWKWPKRPWPWNTA